MRQPRPVLLMTRQLDIGGCERDLTKIALGLDRTRFTPHVACFHASGVRGEELRAAGVPILRLPVRSFFSVSALSGALSLGRYIGAHGIRLVHCFDYVMDLFGVPVAKAFGAGAVVASQFWFSELVEPPLYRRLQPVVNRIADIVVVNCEAVRRQVLRQARLPSSRTFLCYNGVDLDWFYPARGSRPEPLSGASFVIGAVCGLRPEKGIPVLLDAFARVRRLCPRMRLAIVGSGSMLDELKSRALALGIAADCHFEPSTGDVAPWLRAFDIFVLPSLTESFSNAVLEAMACGCCVVGSRVGGTPELIEDGRTGVLFTCGDAADLAAQLSVLIGDSALRARLGAAAAGRAKQFSIQAAIRRIEQLYESLLG